MTSLGWTHTDQGASKSAHACSYGSWNGSSSRRGDSGGPGVVHHPHLLLAMVGVAATAA